MADQCVRVSELYGGDVYSFHFNQAVWFKLSISSKIKLRYSIRTYVRTGTVKHNKTPMCDSYIALSCEWLLAFAADGSEEVRGCVWVWIEI